MSPIINCYNCDAEFEVISSYDTDEEVSFCPYCGSEIDIDEDDSEEDEDYDEDTRH